MRIIIPLDGTPVAENALAPAGQIAAQSDEATQVIIISCVADESDRVNRERYLQAILTRDELAHLRVSAEVINGVPEEGIPRYAADHHANLIVMVTHVSGNPGATTPASVAAQVARRSSIPTLLLRPTAWGRLHAGALQIFVPLEGTRSSEVALTPAIMFARSFQGHLHLAHVVPHSDESPQGQARLHVKAQIYLESVAERVSCFGVPTSVHLLTGLAAEECVRLIHSLQPDIVALAVNVTPEPTVDRSVAEAIFHETTTSLLVSHPFSSATELRVGQVLPVPSLAEVRFQLLDSDQDSLSAQQLAATDAALGLSDLAADSQSIRIEDFASLEILPRDVLAAGD